MLRSFQAAAIAAAGLFASQAEAVTISYDEAATEAGSYSLQLDVSGDIVGGGHTAQLFAVGGQNNSGGDVSTVLTNNYSIFNTATLRNAIDTQIGVGSNAWSVRNARLVFEASGFPLGGPTNGISLADVNSATYTVNRVDESTPTEVESGDSTYFRVMNGLHLGASDPVNIPIGVAAMSEVIIDLDSARTTAYLKDLFNNSTLEIALGGTSTLNIENPAANGNLWSISQYRDLNGNVTGGVRLMMDIVATPVPVPAGAYLLLTGVVGFAGMRRFSRA